MARVFQLWKYWIFGGLIQMAIAAIHIVQQPATQRMKLGVNVTIPCIFDAPATRCYWAMDGDVVDTDSRGRYLFVGNRTLGNCTLKIQEFQLSDSGLWQCGLPKTDSATAVKSKIVKILPKRNSEVPFRQYPTNVAVLPGQSITLPCSFDEEASFCYWLKEGHVKMLRKNHTRHMYTDKITMGECALTIYNVNLEDDGLWQCVYEKVADNIAVLSPIARLRVLVPSKRLYISVNGTAIANGSSLYIPSTIDTTRITCLAEDGNPKTHLSWELGDIKLNGSSINYVTNSAVPNLKTSEIELLEKIDLSWRFQILSCIATHPAFASADVIAQVLILLPEVTTTANVYIRGSNELTLEASTGEDVSIECRANGVPAPKYKWLRRQRGNSEWLWFHNGQNVTFSALEGEYSCLAWNNLSESTVIRSKEFISIMFAAETTQVDIWFREMKLLNPHVTIGNLGNATLRCLANGHPVPTLRWEIWSDDHWEPVQDGHIMTLPFGKGKYSCVAWNIKDSNSTVRSMDVFVNVIEIYGMDTKRIVPPTAVLFGAVASCVALLAVVFAVAIFCQRRKGSASIEDLYKPNPKVTFY